MAQFSGFLEFLDSRSFSSLWYWLVLILMWTEAGRRVLGVPGDVVQHARREPAGEGGLVLLDWLLLNLPRWRIGQKEGPWLLGLGAFLLTSLAVLGFGFGLEMAQALTFLLVPQGLLLVLRLRLAGQLSPLIAAAQSRQMPTADAVAGALRLIVAHRRWVFVLSIVGVAVTALWGALHVAIHGGMFWL